MATALIIVDVQNDFLPGGALAAEKGNDIINPILSVAHEYDYVVVSGDFHPPNHISFADPPEYTDGSWPEHCVAGTEGAEIHPLLLAISHTVVAKGMDDAQEAYSAFEGHIESEDGDLNGTLADWLRERDVISVTVGGLVDEYCVKNTAIDAVNEGFITTLDTELSASLAPDTGQQAIKEMSDAGVTLIA